VLTNAFVDIDTTLAPVTVPLVALRANTFKSALQIPAAGFVTAIVPTGAFVAINTTVESHSVPVKTGWTDAFKS